jgi:dihydrofolate reductase
MRKLRVYNQVSLDGYIADRSGDMSWAHRHDPEWNEFVAGNASGGGELVFGRVTYEMMAGAWGSAEGRARNPHVAERMTALPKLVFSRSLAQATWANTRLVNGDIAAETRRIKAEPGPDLVIMGSASIVAQLSEARLIDEYQVVLCPIVLGGGRTMFDGVRTPLRLAPTQTRSFANGNVVLWYVPAERG